MSKAKIKIVLRKTVFFFSTLKVKIKVQNVLKSGFVISLISVFVAGILKIIMIGYFFLRSANVLTVKAVIPLTNSSCVISPKILQLHLYKK